MGQKHLTMQHREIIARLSGQGLSKRSIARILGYSPTTICNELRRNLNYNRQYLATTAQWKSEARKKRMRKPRKQTRFVVQYVLDKLSLYWSPEQIAGRMRVDYKNSPDRQVSFKTIYRWLRTGSYAKKGTVFTGYARKLRIKGRGKKWGGTKAALPHGTIALPCIETRGETIGFGHWECDLICGGNRSGYLLTLVERSTGFLLAQPFIKKSAPVVTASLIHLLGDLPRSCLQTITYDRGKEFYGFAAVEKNLGLRSYFCHPGCPQEKGLNEQTNGLLRQFFPRTMDFSKLTEAKVKWAVGLINHRPRKKFGYKTTIEVLRDRGLEHLSTLI